MSSLQVITDVRVRGSIEPHNWKCPILWQFMKVIEFDTNIEVIVVSPTTWKLTTVVSFPGR